MSAAMPGQDPPVGRPYRAAAWSLCWVAGTFFLLFLVAGFSSPELHTGTCRSLLGSYLSEQLDEPCAAARDGRAAVSLLSLAVAVSAALSSVTVWYVGGSADNS
jgi:hypothetical protein